MEEDLKPFVDEEGEVIKFNNSLQELRDLCTHLHNAANYCENTFLNPKSNKEKVVENTKEYICRAVVTVVDHLGSVSAALECRLLQSDTAADAQLRINCLKQRLFTCEQYSHKQCLTSHCWNAHFPKHYSRYISPPAASGADESTNKILRESNGVGKIEFGREEEMPLFLYTYNFKPCLVKEMVESESGEATGKETRNNTTSSPGNTNGVAVLPVQSSLLTTTPRAQLTKFQFDQESPKLKKSVLSRGMALKRRGFMSLVLYEEAKLLRRVRMKMIMCNWWMYYLYP